MKLSQWPGRSIQPKPLWLWSLSRETPREFFNAQKCRSAYHPFPETWLPSQISFLPRTPSSKWVPSNEPYIKQSQTLAWRDVDHWPLSPAMRFGAGGASILATGVRYRRKWSPLFQTGWPWELLVSFFFFLEYLPPTLYSFRGSKIGLRNGIWFAIAFGLLHIWKSKQDCSSHLICFL